MRKPDWLLASIAGTLLLGSIGPAQFARAQLLQCASRTLAGNEKSTVIRMIKRTAAGRSVEWESLRACVNPQFARASVPLAREPQPDGNTVLPSVTCERRHYAWKCGYWTTRHLALLLDSGAHEQKVDVQLPPDFDAAEVRPVVDLALRTAPLLRQEQECGFGRRHAGSGPTLDRLKSALQPNEKEVVFELRTSGQEIQLWRGSDAMMFDRTDDPRTPYKFSCWTWELVVT